MKRKQVLLVSLTVLLTVSITTTLTLAQGPVGTGPALAPLASAGTTFTYQGQLKQGSTPVTSQCDFQFGLWDALTVGTQVGVTQTKSTVSVANGLFTTPLDFGANPFNGDARWLGIQVACPPGGAYTPLAPRQALTPAPYALFAGNANMLDGLDALAFAAATHPHSGADVTNGTVADARIDPLIARDSEIMPTILANDGSGSGLDADLLDGQHASAFVTLAGAQTVSGIKTFSSGLGFSDGTTQTTAAKTPKNVIVVAKSGGDYTTITAALTSITANSATNPYLMYVAPGTYTETVTMKPYVDIEGAGELTTKITYTGSAAATTGTVVGANNAELRFLTVENTGSNTFAIAIFNSSATPRLTHVTAAASGGTQYNFGVYNYSSSPPMTNVTATASGGTNNRGVYNNSSSPAMTNVVATASGGTYSHGVYNYSSSPTMKNVTATASGGTDNYGVYNYSSSPAMTNVTATASGGADNNGVFNSSSSPAMTNVVATASGGTDNYGVWNYASSLAIQNSVISASGGSSIKDGIHNIALSGSYTITINNSRVTGGTSTIYQDSYFTTRAGASQLIGGGAQGSGSYRCVASYNGDYIALDPTCK